MPHNPPGLHEGALDVVVNDPVLADLDANVESFFITRSLWHPGQMTSSMALMLRTSSSKIWPHSSQTNSNKGIPTSNREMKR